MTRSARSIGSSHRGRRQASALAALLATGSVFGGWVLSAPELAAAAAAAKHGAASDLLIDAQEWSLWPSRGKLPAGTVYVELWNRGQDAHDTWIRRLDRAGQMVGPVLAKVPVTLPGQVSRATWHLRAGRYELFCSEPGHLMMGMHAI